VLTAYSLLLTTIHQLDLTTPGSSPFEAKFLKQIRQIPNFLKKALLRPQIGHLLYCRVENFCFLWALTTRDFLAKITSLSRSLISNKLSQLWMNTSYEKASPNASINRVLLRQSPPWSQWKYSCLSFCRFCRNQFLER
jgi:hypothetical protein